MLVSDSNRFKSTGHNAGTSLYLHIFAPTWEGIAGCCSNVVPGIGGNQVSTECSFISPSCVIALAVDAAHGPSWTNAKPANVKKKYN